MARSRANEYATLCLALSCWMAAHAHAEPTWDRNQPIQLDARSSDFDYKSGTLGFQAVRISQGGFSIEADAAQATGLDFKDSQWKFSGNVRIRTPDGSLSSNEARLSFHDNAVTNAHASGAPASFEQKQNQRVARGHALHIDYDFIAGVVRLTDDAWLSDGTNEISGHTLVYDMKEQHVRANPEEQDSQRVHITINPRKPDNK